MKSEIRIIYKEDKEFPEKLRTIKKCPEKLYAMGNLELLNTDCISVVGSRKCSEYGINMAEKFSKELAIKGITIVSGLAVRNRCSSTYFNN